jgi:hypothetical protein
MKELKDILDQLDSISHDDCTKELSAKDNALVIVGNVQKLTGSEDRIIVSPLNDSTRKFQFNTQDIDKMEKLDNHVFKVFIKADSSCIVMSNAGTLKSSARTRRRKRFDFAKMNSSSYRSGVVSVCDVYCDSCVVGPCYDCYCDCDSCICDCDYVA